MSIKMDISQQKGSPKPQLAVLGVGGGGGNAVTAMNSGEHAVTGVTFITANTDVQALEQTAADRRIELGSAITNGYGAGTDPDVGQRAAEESVDDLRDALKGMNMVFVTGGMGGGTGTGAGPVIARVARELGVLCVGVVTTPFEFEGAGRMEAARKGVDLMLEHCDTLLLIGNQNIFMAEGGVPPLLTAFEEVNSILRNAIRGVVDLVTRPQMINLDFADVLMVLRKGGLGVIGEGVAAGGDRARQAAIKAARNPLLDGVSLAGAERLLLNVTGGKDLSLDDFNAASDYVRELARPGANVKVGASFDETLDGSVRVYVAASGVERTASMDPGRARAGRRQERAGPRVREIHVPDQPDRRPPARAVPAASHEAGRLAAEAPDEDASQFGRHPGEKVESAILPSVSSRDASDWNDGIVIDKGSLARGPRVAPGVRDNSSVVAVSPTFSGDIPASGSPAKEPSVGSPRRRRLPPSVRRQDGAAVPASPTAGAGSGRASPSKGTTTSRSGLVRLPLQEPGASASRRGAPRDMGIRVGEQSVSVAATERNRKGLRDGPGDADNESVRGVSEQSPGLVYRIINSFRSSGEE